MVRSLRFGSVVNDDSLNQSQGTMAERKNTHGLSLTRSSNRTIVDIGDMEIWDGADLSLIRDTLSRLIEKERRKSVAIQMKAVKYVPSGFFWHAVRLFRTGCLDPVDRTATENREHAVVPSLL